MTNYAPVVAVVIVVVVVVVLSGPYTHCGIKITSNVLSVDVIIWGGLQVTGRARSYGVIGWFRASHFIRHILQ